MPAPKFDPKPPKNLTKGKIVELKDALEIMLPIPLGLENTGAKTRYKSWTNPRQLSKEVLDLTEQDDIKDAYYVLTEWENAPEYSETTTEAPKYEASNSTMLSAATRASQEAERKFRAEAKAAADIKGVEQTEKLIERLKGRKVYATVTQTEAPKLSVDEERAYKDVRSLAQENPKQLAIDISDTIVVSIPEEIKRGASPEEIKLYADTVAQTAVENLQIGPIAPNPEIVILAKVAETPEAIKVEAEATTAIKTASMETAVLLNLSYQGEKQALSAIFGPKITSLIVGDTSLFTVTKLSDSPEGATHAVELDKLIKNHLAIQQNPVFTAVGNEFKTKLVSLGREQLTARLSSFSEGVLKNSLATSKFQGILQILKPYQAFEFVGTPGITGQIGGLVMKFSPESAPLLSGLGKLLGVGDFGIKPIAGEIAKNTIKKAGSSVIQTGLKTVVLKVGGAGAAKALASLSGTIFGPIGTAITTAITYVGSKILGKIVPVVNRFVNDNKEVLFGVGLLGIMSGILPLQILGGASSLAGGAAGLKSGGFTLGGAFSSLSGLWGLIWETFAPSVGVPILVTLLVFPVVVALILFIINSGAYIVPPAPVGESIINIPPGGNLTKCDPKETGNEITSQLAASIRAGSVVYLPDSAPSRRQGLCMDPTMIVLHTSGGYDNDDGNVATYNTLVQRNVSCQMATDTNDTILMLSFFDKQVEFSWCADNLNAGGVSIEMAGECQGACAAVSKCSPNTNLTYTPNGPHPCAPLEDLSFNAVCKVMQKYKIPWTQVFQHEASNGTHTDPIGDAWVDKFILRLKNSCPV